jgi:hypothetical protein
MIPLLLTLLCPARAEDPPPPAPTEEPPPADSEMSRRERRRAEPPDPRGHIPALVPGQLNWPMANLRYSHKLRDSISVEGGLQIGEYNPSAISLIRDELSKHDIDAPLKMLSPEVGVALHVNNRFDRGLRIGASVKTVRIATEVTLYEKEANGAKVSSDATLSLVGAAPLLYVGYRTHNKLGFVFDYRVGGGVMKSKANATVSAEASIYDEQLAELTQDFNAAFDSPWVVNQISVGWLF